MLLPLIFAAGLVHGGGVIAVALQEPHMTALACRRTLVEQQELRSLAVQLRKMHHYLVGAWSRIFPCRTSQPHCKTQRRHTKTTPRLTTKNKGDAVLLISNVFFLLAN